MDDATGRIVAASAAARSALTDIRGELVAARAELDVALRQPLLSPEERKALQEAAERGDMGREMRGFADDVGRGEADWESFLRGDDDRGALLAGFVQRSEIEHGERLGAAFADAPAPSDVDDPRPPRGGPQAP
ncbi:MAG: hypothetical protein F2667_03350 [Actinobacteria bacterium]|uniref:Unannotated protein n=1 Tax=freshwater metagenome TaxID=449393 RepID=A0A6J6P981_9ZZZZ|nr:hypothetical protein [Actinomycetota bacterium]